MMSVRQLIYTSVATSEFKEWMIKDILNTSVENNKKHDITGLLLYHDNQFMQVIEGTKKDIGNLLRNLYFDKRHNHVTVIVDRIIQNREFPTWQMAFKKLQKENDEHLIQFSNYVAEKPSKALSLLKNIFDRF